MRKFIQSKSVWQITVISLLAFFATVGVVMAATTIGTNITTGGSIYATSTLYVDGAATFNSTLAMGTLAAARAIDSVLTDNYVPMQVNAKYSLANPASAYTLMGGYFKVANDTLDQANLQLVGLGSRVSMGKNATDAYGLQSHLTLANGANSNGNLTAVSGKTMLHGDNTSGIVTAGLFTLEGYENTLTSETYETRSPNTAYGVWADIVHTNIAAGYVLNANDSTIASGLSFTKSGTGAITKELTFQNGETIDNASDGIISLTGIASTTSIRLANLETITNATNGTITLTENTGSAFISFTPATGVITPSTGMLYINASSTVLGYATTTVQGIIMPTSRAAAPATCGPLYVGGLSYDSTKGVLCICIGTTWLQATSSAGTCF